MKKGELNEKQEKFCQKYALSGNASDSAQSAGYASSSAKVQGFKLLQLPYINERIEELRSEMTTSYDVVKELEEQYAYAKSHGHTNSALKALELLSRIRGNNTDIEGGLDEKSLEDGIVQCLNILGADKVFTLLNKCDFMDEEEEEQEETGTPSSWGEATTDMQ